MLCESKKFVCAAYEAEDCAYTIGEVIFMSDKRPYSNSLNDLLAESSSAKSYFMSLPDYIQGMIQQRSDNVHNVDELRRYAENLLQGDK